MSKAKSQPRSLEPHHPAARDRTDPGAAASRKHQAVTVLVSQTTLAIEPGDGDTKIVRRRTSLPGAASSATGRGLLPQCRDIVSDVSDLSDLEASTAACVRCSTPSLVRTLVT